MVLIKPVPRPGPVVLAAAELVECLCEQLIVNGAGPVCWCGLWAGAEVPWEYCSDCGGTCGMAWLRPSDVFPYNTFPTPVLDANCTAPLAWRFEMGVIRCIPTPTDGGLPDPDTMSEVVQSMMADSWAMYLTMQCCDAGRIAPESYAAVGPQGGCVGGVWTGYMEIEGV